LQEGFPTKTKSILTGKNVLNTPASFTDGFLWRDTCISSTQLNRPVLIKQNLFPPSNLWLAKGLLSKTNSLLTGNNALDTPATKNDGFLWNDTCVSSTVLNRPIWNKMSLSPVQMYDLQKVFL
jgi:hypothetical protein